MREKAAVIMISLGNTLILGGLGTILKLLLGFSWLFVLIPAAFVFIIVYLFITGLRVSED